MEIIYEQNSAKSEISTSNSALREVYSNGLEKSESPLPAFATQFLETVANDTHCNTDLEELITVAAGKAKIQYQSCLKHTVRKWHIHICFILVNTITKKYNSQCY